MKMLNNRYFILFLILIIIIVLILKGVTGWPPFSGNIGERRAFLGPYSWVGQGINLNLVIKPPKSLDEDRTEIKISNLTYYHPEKPLLADEFCIESISVYENAFSNFGIRGYGGFSPFDFPKCYELNSPSFLDASAENGSTSSVYPEDLNEWIEERESRIGKIKNLYYGYSIKLNNNELTNDLFANPNGFWFPLDDFKTDFTLFLRFYLKKDGVIILRGKASPKIHADVIDSPDWDISVEITDNKRLHSRFLENHENIDGNLSYSSVGLDFTRPLILKLTYPIVLISMLLFIFMLTQVKSIDTFIEGSLAILFGLFGLKEILIPTNTEIRTFLDLALLILYMLFGLLVIWYIVRKHLLKNIGRHSKDIEHNNTNLIDNDNPQQHIINLDNISQTNAENKSRNILYLFLLGLGISTIVIKRFIEKITSK
ncbi:MAG: hypothetical protein KC421_15620 [Anaerolineales bacterium]|nr:hypothetical protein [Anaerolineales bacterium]